MHQVAENVCGRIGDTRQHGAARAGAAVLVDGLCTEAGVDHVGLGSDYDGIGRTPQGLEDASCYGRLAERMRERGLAADEVAKVLHGNMRRVFAAATGRGTVAGRV